MKIANDITELIGKTPLVRIRKLNSQGKAEVVVKLESFNPMSSVKDRVAKAMIDDAEKKGILTRDSLIIEPTSGNTGVGLAYIAAVKGYKLILTMPETMSVERRQLLKALGAEIVLTEGAKGMSGAIEKAEELLSKHPNSWAPRQFNNDANPMIHRNTTAREIWEDTDGRVDIVVGGAGTGGTISGVSEFLKSQKKIYAVAVEPEKSPVLSGGVPGSHKIQGIGAGFIPKTYNPKVIDEIFAAKEEDAFETARNAAKKEGILMGISSGAALWAGLEISKRAESEGKLMVVIIPDTGERYLSTELFNL